MNAGEIAKFSGQVVIMNKSGIQLRIPTTKDLIKDYGEMAFPSVALEFLRLDETGKAHGYIIGVKTKNGRRLVCSLQDGKRADLPNGPDGPANPFFEKWEQFVERGVIILMDVTSDPTQNW